MSKHNLMSQTSSPTGRMTLQFSPFTHLGIGQRGRTWLSALILALALTGLPLLDGYLPDSLRNLVAPTVQAGCQGGSCG